MKKLFLLFLLLFIAFWVKKNFYPPLLFERGTPAPLTGAIQIEGRKLLLNGKPFIMKGICYNPVAKGKVHPEGLITQHPTEEDLKLIEADFKMMKEAGINTIRTYEALLDHRILALLNKYELKTIVPIFNYYASSMSKVNEILYTLKDEPSTLIWEIGNEWNENFFYSKNRDPKKKEGIGVITSMQLIADFASYIKSVDRTHPVSTTVALFNPLEDKNYWNLLNSKNLDIIGVNIYSLGFKDAFLIWSEQSSKPLYLGEFGANAYNTLRNKEDLLSQKMADALCLKEIKENLSADSDEGVLIGGCVFEWNDEWWKSPGDPNKHKTTGIKPSHSAKMLPHNIEGPYPDHSFNEEWWGIMDIDRNPRPVYNEIKEYYTQKF